MKSFEGLNLLIFIGGWEKYDQYLGTFYKVVRTSLIVGKFYTGFAQEFNFFPLIELSVGTFYFFKIMVITVFL